MEQQEKRITNTLTALWIEEHEKRLFGDTIIIIPSLFEYNLAL